MDVAAQPGDDPRPPRGRPAGVWMTALLLLAGLVLVDARTPWELGFSAFYMLPVLWVAWNRGTWEGVAMAILAGTAFYVVDLTTGQPFSRAFYRVWNALNHEGTYLVAAWAVGSLARGLRAQRTLATRLEAALAEVKELRGYLPVCAWCHRIRDEGGDWHTLEAFLATHTRASTTHGICPDCAREFRREGEDAAPVA